MGTAFIPVSWSLTFSFFCIVESNSMPFGPRWFSPAAERARQPKLNENRRRSPGRTLLAPLVTPLLWHAAFSRLVFTNRLSVIGRSKTHFVLTFIDLSKIRFNDSEALMAW